MWRWQRRESRCYLQHTPVCANPNAVAEDTRAIQDLKLPRIWKKLAVCRSSGKRSYESYAKDCRGTLRGGLVWTIAYRAACFHFIHAFGNGRRSYASEPISKSVEWKCSKKCRRPTQREFQVTYFANNKKWIFLYCSCICKTWHPLNDNSFYSLVTHQLNIMQSPAVKDWIYNNNVGTD